MRLSQIIAEADDHVNYAGLDPSIIEQLSKYKPHQQQWAVRELRDGGDINSVVDALDYYIAKIGDNRFQNILKHKTPNPKNILSLSFGDIKAAQHDFEIQYNSLSRRERERLKSNVVFDTPGLKVVEFKKSSAGDTDTAKALAAAAQFTKWCVVNTETGNHYLNQGPIYLITMNKAEVEGKTIAAVVSSDAAEVVVDNGQPVATNQYLCHVASNQLMNVWDKKEKLPERICLKLKKYITGVGIFCNDKSSDIYIDALKYNPKLAFEYADDVINGRWPEAEPTIMQNPYWAYKYADNVIKGRWPEAEPTIMKHPETAYKYARHIIKGRWPEAEPTIAQRAGTACDYAVHIIKGRWPKAEPTIIKDLYSIHFYARFVIEGRWPEAESRIIQANFTGRDDKATIADLLYRYARDIISGRWPEVEPTIIQIPEVALEYAAKIIKGRWPEAEPTIMKKPVCAFIYARDIIKDRWLQAEPYIMQDPEWWRPYQLMLYNHALHVVKGRWLRAEPIIMRNAEFACGYARNIIKGRWPKAEQYIMKHPFYAWLYVRDIIKGRWPQAEPYIMRDQHYWETYQTFLRMKDES